MASQTEYRYVAETFTTDGRPLGDLSLEPDFEPVLQWSHFHAVREGTIAPTMTYESGAIEPVWDDSRDEPYVSALRAAVRSGGQQASLDLPFQYLHPSVVDASAALVSAGKLDADAKFRYRICAFVRQAAGTASREHGLDLDISMVPEPLSLTPADLFASLAAAERRGDTAWRDTDMPVLVPAEVLDEASVAARAAGDVETGGLLVGHLHRDSSGGEVFANVSAQIPARHTLADHARLTFTAETWADARAALALRGRGEMLLGWWHFHPHFCAKCPPERRRLCTLATPFFSREDCNLHRAVFSRAFDLALLLTDTGGPELHTDLFGWRDAVVAARGFHVVTGRD